MTDLDVSVAETLKETSFELESRVIAYNGTSRRLPTQRIPGAELKRVCGAEAVGVVRSSVRVHPPDAPMSRLLSALRDKLECFVDPQTDQIGHAFFIEGGNDQAAIRYMGGLYGLEFVSPLRNFAEALLQAAGLDGVDNAIGRLAGWVRDEPLRVSLSTVLDGLRLSSAVKVEPDVEAVPLPLTTSELPRLPFNTNWSPVDYLGRTRLTIHLAARPALFRPEGGRSENILRFTTDPGIDFDLVCQALSLHANRHVDWCGFWHDFPDAASFNIAGPNPWSPGAKRSDPLWWESTNIDETSGNATITPSRSAQFLRLNGSEVGGTLQALRQCDSTTRIAVERWRRSKGMHVRLADRYIDLRIAMESLFLKGSGGNQEPRFRLALFGAWYLGKDLDDRRNVRKILREAYDASSKAVHTGQVSDEKTKDSWKAQELCRRGILKLLHEGAPAAWDDLILGG